MRRYDAVPHPFVLRLGGLSDEGRACSLHLTLFGHGNRSLSVLVYALTRAAGEGRGVAGNLLELQCLMQESAPGSGEWVNIYQSGGVLEPLGLAPVSFPPPGELSVTLDTPLRVKRDGRHVAPDRFRFADLFSGLLRRISMLTYFHTETPLETDFRTLTESAKQVTGRSQLLWKDLSRYSAHQKARMQLGGLVGTIELDGQDLAPFWPYLWLGQWTHAGTAATMGLGHYTLASLPSRTAEPLAE